MIIGTSNTDKIQEIASRCKMYGIKIESKSLDIPETGSSCKENAALKAIGYSEACPNQYVLVEDSGLVVPALNNLPGPWSARFYDLNLLTREVIGAANLSREELDALNYNKVISTTKRSTSVRAV